MIVKSPPEMAKRGVELLSKVIHSCSQLAIGQAPIQGRLKGATGLVLQQILAVSWCVSRVFIQLWELFRATGCDACHLWF